MEFIDDKYIIFNRKGKFYMVDWKSLVVSFISNGGNKILQSF